METQRVFMNVVRLVSGRGYGAGKTLPDRSCL